MWIEELKTDLKGRRLAIWQGTAEGLSAEVQAAVRQRWLTEGFDQPAATEQPKLVTPKEQPAVNIVPTSKLAVVTLAVGKMGSDLLALSEASLRAYAKRIGADFHAHRTPNNPGFVMEDKFIVARYLDHYERVIWVDADIIIRDHAPNLFELVPPTQMGLVNEIKYNPPGSNLWDWDELHNLQTLLGFPVDKPEVYWNTGLMVLSRFHRHLFNSPTKPYKLWRNAEQHIVNVRMHALRVPTYDLGQELVWLWCFDNNVTKAAGKPFLHFAGAYQHGETYRLRMMQLALNAPYLINLDRRPDRLQAVTEEWGKTGLEQFKRLPAVDGSKLPLPTGWIAGAGAYGCRESHLAILREAITQNMPAVMVFEDDVTFVDDFAPRLQQLLRDTPPNAVAIFVGGQHMNTHPPLATANHNILRAQNVHRTHGYILFGQQYMRHLYQVWSSGNTHIDHIWGNDHQRDWEVYTPREWLCGQAQGKSDINGRELGERFWKPRRVKETPATTCIPCGKKKQQRQIR